MTWATYIRHKVAYADTPTNDHSACAFSNFDPFVLFAVYGSLCFCFRSSAYSIIRLPPSTRSPPVVFHETRPYGGTGIIKDESVSGIFISGSDIEEVESSRSAIVRSRDARIML